MKHFLSKFALFGIFVGFWATANGAIENPVNGENNKMTINVGIYAPFSNDSAFIGRNMLGAMEIARAHLMSSDITYEFYTLDQILDKPKATKVLQKFIETNHINVMLTEGKDNGTLVAPLAQKNNIIHFCLSSDFIIADGRNNFLAQDAHYQKSAVLAKTAQPEFIAQFKQEYFSHPITQAGYAYDIFHIVHNSAVLAMKTHSDFSSQAVATHLLALEPGSGVMGNFSMNKNGIAYKKPVVTV